MKNLIVTPNGKNVYPEEVENEILKSPYIAEVMVYGHKVGRWRRRCMRSSIRTRKSWKSTQRNREAFSLGRGSGVASPLEVARACDNLPGKRVKKITIREEEFPKTTTRKIKRFQVEAFQRDTPQGNLLSSNPQTI